METLIIMIVVGAAAWFLFSDKYEIREKGIEIPPDIESAKDPERLRGKDLDDESIEQKR